MKLPTLLRSLRPEEHRDFEKFLQSPFFKTSDQYLKFFRFLCRYHPGFVLEKADLETAYRRCFGAQSLTDSKLYNLMSGLGRQLEQFLVVQMVVEPAGNGGGSLHDQLLVKALGQRNMGAYFRAEAQRLIDATTTRPAMDANDYLVLQQLHYEVYYNPDTPKAGETDSHLKLAAQYLDQYYCLAKLHYVAEMKVRERMNDVRYDPPLLEAVLEYSAASDLSETHPVWSLYFHLVKLYHEGLSKAGFRELQGGFTGCYPLLPQNDQSLLLRLLINAGVSLHTRGEEVEADLLALYKLALEAGMLLDNNRFTHLSFINITSLAAVCREFDWADSFIAQFSPFLEESKRQPAVDLARATLHHARGRLDEAQSCLTPEVFSIALFDGMARMLQLRINFDRYLLHGKDYEFLMSHLRAFEKFVSAKALQAEKKTALLNCIRFARKMAAIKFKMVDVPASQRELLRKKLRELEPVASKRWLGTRIDAL